MKAKAKFKGLWLLCKPDGSIIRVVRGLEYEGLHHIVFNNLIKAGKGKDGLVWVRPLDYKRYF